MTLSNIPILLPAGMLAAAVLATLLGAWRPVSARAVALAATLGATVLAAIGLERSLDDEPLVHEVGGWAAPLGIEYVLDPLSGFIAVLIGLIGFLVVLYPPRVGFLVSPDRTMPLHALTLLLLGGLLGVAMAGDLFNLFVFLEVYSIAAYALIALGGPLAALASFRYLILGTIGSSFYLLGVGFVYFTTGTLSMSEAAAELPALAGSPTLAAAAVLMVVGLGVKMAIFPLHVWLPEAHSQAPPAAAALLASVQVKVAAYALIRILLDVLPPSEVLDDLPIMTALVWFSAGGIVVGSVLAIRQDDIKRMLAYSTVAQLGYIGIGIGLASPLALVAALLHVVNHAFMKGCLFFVAGSIYDRTGRKRISELGGLGPKMPWTMAAFTIAAVSMIGLPPTAGFFSKWYLIVGAADVGSWVVAAVIVASSLLTLTYFLRALEAIWFKSPADDEITDPRALADAARTESGPMVLAPIVVLATGVIVLGLVNVSIVEHILEPVSFGLLER